MRLRTSTIFYSYHMRRQTKFSTHASSSRPTRFGLRDDRRRGKRRGPFRDRRRLRACLANLSSRKQIRRPDPFVAKTRRISREKIHSASHFRLRSLASNVAGLEILGDSSRRRWRRRRLDRNRYRRERSNPGSASVDPSAYLIVISS